MVVQDYTDQGELYLHIQKHIFETGLGARPCCVQYNCHGVLLLPCLLIFMKAQKTKAIQFSKRLHIQHTII